MGENHFAVWPVAVYGSVLGMAAIAYYILSRTLVSRHGKNSALARALGRDFKGRLSVVVYAAAIPLAFVSRWIAVALYVLVAVMWLVPDRRLENSSCNKAAASSETICVNYDFGRSTLGPNLVQSLSRTQTRYDLIYQPKNLCFFLRCLLQLRAEQGKLILHQSFDIEDTAQRSCVAVLQFSRDLCR